MTTTAPAGPSSVSSFLGYFDGAADDSVLTPTKSSPDRATIATSSPSTVNDEDDDGVVGAWDKYAPVEEQKSENHELDLLLSKSTQSIDRPSKTLKKKKKKKKKQSPPKGLGRHAQATSATVTTPIRKVVEPMKESFLSPPSQFGSLNLPELYASSSSPNSAYESVEEKKVDYPSPIVSPTVEDATGGGMFGTALHWDSSDLMVPAALSIEEISEDYETKLAYIRDEQYGWLPGQVMKERDGKAEVQVVMPHPSIAVMKKKNNDPSERVTVNLKDYPGEKLPLQNFGAKRDMVDLENLNEPAILYNLQQRHANLLPYTRVGDILVSMNPFQWISSLYTMEKQKEYTQSVLGQDMNAGDEFLEYKNYFERMGIEPHVYEVSALAYRGLVRDGRNQTILVTGESGAGKTETVKILMSHLATIPQNSAMEIVTKVCQASPVFEAFGNAKTLRNHNSSRFGRFIQMQFRVEDGKANMIGSVCTSYMLEKTRVVSQAPGERTYHIFYQLTSAAMDFKQKLWPFFSSCRAEDFAYLSGSGRGGGQTRLDSKHWDKTLRALSLFGFTGETLLELMRALAIVLQLGNLVFEDIKDKVGYRKSSQRSDEEYATVIKSSAELERLAEMTGIGTKHLEQCMTCRVLKTSAEEVKAKASPQVAKEWCDALAKEIYSRMFDMMVRKVNESTAIDVFSTGAGGSVGHISLLDIFGFEKFRVNRFEQLCINYANEKLHYKYIVDNFNTLKDIYETEGVDFYSFSTIDNSRILDLLESRGGIISALNEECHLPRGKNDENFVAKAKRNHSKRSSFVHKRLHNRTEFEIRHFAGSVKYQADGFVARNMDKLPDGIIECASKTTNSLIRAEFRRVAGNVGSAGPPRRGSMKKNKFVLEKFQIQLKSLIAAMEGSETRYIRCIKPNDEKSPRKIDHVLTLQQLKCSGLMTAIEIARESYPDIISFDVIQDRFSCLLREVTLDSRDHRNKSGRPKIKTREDMVMAKLSKLVDPKTFVRGKTKVFFKNGSKEKLEVRRLNYLNGAAVLIQKQARRTQAIRALETLKKEYAMANVIQHWSLMCIQIKRLSKKRRSAILLAASIRRYLAIHKVEDMRQQRAATRIQSRCRTWQHRTTFLSLVDDVITIQTYVRRSQARERFLTLYCERQERSAVRIQSYYRTSRSIKYVAKAIEAIITIQSSVRGTQAKTRYLAMREEIRERSAVQIQTCYRRSRSVDYLRRAVRATIAIQSNVRAHQARKRYMIMQYERRTRAAIQIQTCCRRSRSVDYLRRAVRATIAIQSNVRAHQARKRYMVMQYERRTRAAIQIQARCRASQKTKQFKRATKAILTLQCLARRVKAKDAFLVLWIARAELAATKIQARYRSTVQVKEFRRAVDAATTIQSMARLVKAREAFLLLWIEHAERAATKIQALYRARQGVKDFKRAVAAVTTIQGLSRMFRAKKHTATLRQAVMMVQSMLNMRHPWDALKEQTTASTCIATWYRAVKDRRMFLKLRRESAASSRIAALFRGDRARRLAFRIRRRNYAARKFQSLVRMLKARRVADQKRRERDAAKVIQLWTKQMLQLRHGRAMTIQRAFRNHRQQKAATKIQTKYRASYLERHGRALGEPAPSYWCYLDRMCCSR